MSSKLTEEEVRNSTEDNVLLLQHWIRGCGYSNRSMHIHRTQEGGLENHFHYLVGVEPLTRRSGLYVGPPAPKSKANMQRKEASVKSAPSHAI